MNSKFSKILCVVMCVFMLALTLTACKGTNNDMTESNITATISEVESALREFDTKKLKKYVDSPTLSMIMKYADSHKQFKELGKAIFSSLEINVKEIDTEQGIVTVTVNNKELYGPASDFASELKSNYGAIQLLAKLTDDDFLDTNLAMLTQKIADAPMKEQPAEINLKLTPGKKNLVVSFDSIAEDVVSGGALEAIKSIYAK